MYKRIASLVLLLALTAAACGSGSSADALATLDEPETSGAELATLDGSDGSATDDAPAAELDTDEAMLALADCLRDQGFEVQDPEIDEDGFPRIRTMFQPLMESGEIGREEMRTAMDACSVYSDAIRTQFGETDRSDIEDQIYEYASCMRDNGFEMADPDFSTEPGEGQGQGQGGGPFGGLDRDDPEFQAAHEVCQDLFVGGGPGGGPGGGAGGGAPRG